MSRIATANSGGRRRPTNLSIREEVMKAVKDRGLNASKIAEEALIEALHQADRETWLAGNAEAIASHNERVERVGMFNDGLRRF